MWSPAPIRAPSMWINQQSDGPKECRASIIGSFALRNIVSYYANVLVLLTLEVSYAKETSRLDSI